MAGNCTPSPVTHSNALLADLRCLIEQARAQVAQTTNSALTMLCWHVGQRIQREVLGDERAGYGEQIVATLSHELMQEFGRGFTHTALTRMMKFTECFPDEAVVASLARQLGWSHFVELLPLKQPLEREFYAEMCHFERWSVRTLRERIGSQLYLRAVLAKKPDAVVKAERSHLRAGGQMTPDLVFRDPYVLDFLDLPEGYSERSLKDAVLRDIERFLLDLGMGFTFVARQKRISIGKDDFHLDLLFFHRRLRRLVAVDLKLERFQPAHKSQMKLYLRWLDKHDRAPGEGSPLGLILCTGADSEQVELMDLESAGIGVAEYLAKIPEAATLQQRLHRAIEQARERATNGRQGAPQVDPRGEEE